MLARKQRGRHRAPPKPQRNHQKDAVRLLKGWLLSEDHADNPYPTDAEKTELMARTGLTKKQLCNWFVNARKRVLQPVLAAKKRKVDDSRRSQTGHKHKRKKCQNPRISKTVSVKIPPTQQKRTGAKPRKVTVGYKLIDKPPSPSSVFDHGDSENVSVGHPSTNPPKTYRQTATHPTAHGIGGCHVLGCVCTHGSREECDQCAEHRNAWNFVTPFGNSLRQQPRQAPDEEPRQNCGYMLQLYSSLFSASEIKFFFWQKFIIDPGLPACPGLS
jgi:hypothetical protein